MRVVHLGSFTTDDNVCHVLLATIPRKWLFKRAQFPEQHTKGINIDRLVVRTISCHCVMVQIEREKSEQGVSGRDENCPIGLTFDGHIASTSSVTSHAISPFL